MCDLLIPALLVGGALMAFSGAGCESGCYPAASYSACGTYAHTPCSTAYVEPGIRTQPASGYRYAAGFAPTPAYTTGTQYYDYSGNYAVGYGSTPLRNTSSPYARSSQYYHY